MVSPEMGRKLTGRVEGRRSAEPEARGRPDGNRAVHITKLSFGTLRTPCQPLSHPVPPATHPLVHTTVKYYMSIIVGTVIVHSVSSNSRNLKVPAPNNVFHLQQTLDLPPPRVHLLEILAVRHHVDKVCGRQQRAKERTHQERDKRNDNDR